RENLYFKIQLVDPLSFYEHRKYTLKCFIMDSRDIDFSLPMIRISPVDFAIHYNNDAGYVAEVIGAGVAAFEDVMEFKLNSRKAGLKSGEKIKVYFKIVSPEGIELERVPAAGSIDIVIADEPALFTLWDV
ncbi:MAG TPA: hypothetical protein P5044_11850, partial [bacterium]|nr:hypothetical protein [bacterium]